MLFFSIATVAGIASRLSNVVIDLEGAIQQALAADAVEC
jgi:hypothetical protein